MIDTEHKRLKDCEDQLVEMQLKGGEMLTAMVVNVSQDLDGSQHVIYECPTGSTHSYCTGKNSAYSISAEEIVSFRLA